MPKSDLFHGILCDQWPTGLPFSVYILSTATCNGAKAKFYDEDLPSFEDVSKPLVEIEECSRFPRRSSVRNSRTGSLAQLMLRVRIDPDHSYRAMLQDSDSCSKPTTQSFGRVETSSDCSGDGTVRGKSC
jgi:hypothetical protein